MEPANEYPRTFEEMDEMFRTGINFGFLSNYGGHWLLVAFSIAVSLGLTTWVRNKRGWILPLATAVVVGGALGNAFDRAIYGAVADYLNMSCCGINNPYSLQHGMSGWGSDRHRHEADPSRQPPDQRHGVLRSTSVPVWTRQIRHRTRILDDAKSWS